jgi:hypothetical protein
VNIKQRYQFQKYLRDLQETGKEQKVSAFDWTKTLARIEEEFAQGEEVVFVSFNDRSQEKAVCKQLRKMGFLVDESSYYDNICRIRLKPPFRVNPYHCIGLGTLLVCAGAVLGFWSVPVGLTGLIIGFALVLGGIAWDITSIS